MAAFDEASWGKRAAKTRSRGLQQTPCEHALSSNAMDVLVTGTAFRLFSILQRIYKVLCFTIESCIFVPFAVGL